MTQLQTERGMVRVPAGTWHVDPTHSSVAFEVKHLMIATVRGHFSEFEGTIEAAEDDPANSRAWGSMQVASFESTRIEHIDGGRYRVAGNLTIRDETREVEFEGCVDGAAEDPWGNERVGITVRGTIDRTDFGLTWQQMLASGGMLVGEDVKILIDVSAV